MKSTSYSLPFEKLLLALSHSWVAKRLVAWRGHLAIVSLSVLAIVFFVISFLIHQPGLQRVDFVVTRWMQSFRNPVFDLFANGFTFLGNTATLMGIGAVSILVFLWRRRPRAAFLCLVSLIGVPLNYAIKGVFGRPRPDATLVEVLAPTIGLSFPSGHAMASTMLFGFLGLMMWLHAPTPRLRFYGVVGFGGTAIMISLSRVYLGAHWLSDVVGGMTSGVFFLLVFAEIYKWWNKEPYAPGVEK